jgi:hypothetical protein
MLDFSAFDAILNRPDLLLCRILAVAEQFEKTGAQNYLIAPARRRFCSYSGNPINGKQLG